MKLLAIAIAVAGLTLTSLPASAHGKFHRGYFDGCGNRVKVVKVVDTVREVPCCNFVSTSCSFCGW